MYVLTWLDMIDVWHVIKYLHAAVHSVNNDLQNDNSFTSIAMVVFLHYGYVDGGNAKAQRCAGPHYKIKI